MWIFRLIFLPRSTANDHELIARRSVQPKVDLYQRTQKKVSYCGAA